MSIEKRAEGPGDKHYYCDDVRCGANKFYKEGYLAGTKDQSVLGLVDALELVGGLDCNSYCKVPNRDNSKCECMSCVARTALKAYKGEGSL